MMLVSCSSYDGVMITNGGEVGKKSINCYYNSYRDSVRTSELHKGCGFRIIKP